MHVTGFTGFKYETYLMYTVLNLQALTLVGPTDTSPVLDPLTVLRFDNRLYILQSFTFTCESHQIV